MSSTTNNLREKVVSASHELQQNEKAAQAAYDAAEFALYYAQSATINAGSQLTAIQQVCVEKDKIKKETAAVNSCVLNIADAADRFNQITKQAVSNVSVCAADVQKTANSIVQLASNTGTIYSMLTAADFGTDLYQLSKELYELTNQLAYDAESAAQTAMESSAATAEVPAQAVFDKATHTGNATTAIMKTIADGHATAMQSLSKQNTLVELLNLQEKKAEAVVTKTKMAADAATTACSFYNHTFNLDLTVTEVSPGNYMISFRPLCAPFDGNTENHLLYPVSTYYIMPVNECEKTLFDWEDAEARLATQGNYIAIPSLKKQAPHTSGTDLIHHSISLEDIRRCMQAEPLMDNNIVVFVYAIYEDMYKKKRNSFENFLSAHSNSFSVSDRLVAVDGKNIKQDAKAPHKIHFTVAENPSYADAVEYRCILLPKQDTGFALLDVHLTNTEGKTETKQETKGPGFLFNIDIAEQVSAGNYLIAKPAAAPAKKIKNDPAGTFPVTHWIIEIEADTTDNFGNPLVAGQAYLPVILSVSTVPGSAPSVSINNWSGYHHSSPVIFKAK